MLRPGVDNKKRGIALYLVIGTLIIVAILAKVILTVVLSQLQVSRHNVARIQAYYAAQGGMNYAFENLRTGNWTWTSCTSAAPCDVTDINLPYPPITTLNASTPAAIQQFRVIFCPSGTACPPANVTCSPPIGYSYCVNISVKYTSSNITT